VTEMGYIYTLGSNIRHCSRLHERR
jgi:hypothetical protein